MKCSAFRFRESEGASVQTSMSKDFSKDFFFLSSLPLFGGIKEMTLCPKITESVVDLEETVEGTARKLPCSPEFLKCQTHTRSTHMYEVQKHLIRMDITLNKSAFIFLIVWQVGQVCAAGNTRPNRKTTGRKMQIKIALLKFILTFYFD